MPFEPSTIRVDKYLTGIARTYRITDYAWATLFPELVVDAETGFIKVTKREGYFKGLPIKNTGVKAEELEGAYTRISYECTPYGGAEFIYDDDVARAEAGVFNLRQDATWRMTDRMNLTVEIRAMQVATGGAISTSSPDHQVTPTYKWDDTTSSTPLQDITTAIESIKRWIGVTPNVFVLGAAVYYKLAVHPAVSELMKYTGREPLVEGGLPGTVLGLKVVNAGGVYNSADQGLTASMSDVWGKNAFVVYVNPASPVNFARMLFWKNKNRRIRTWRNEELEAQVIEGQVSCCPKVITPDAAYWFESVVA